MWISFLINSLAVGALVKRICLTRILRIGPFSFLTFVRHSFAKCPTFLRWLHVFIFYGTVLQDIYSHNENSLHCSVCFDSFALRCYCYLYRISRKDFLLNIVFELNDLSCFKNCWIPYKHAFLTSFVRFCALILQFCIHPQPCQH